MTSEENVIEKVQEDTQRVDNSEHELVMSFVELVDKYKMQSTRIEKMSDIEEDYRILEGLSERLPTGNKPSMKSSIYHKILKIYDTGASKLPKIKPQDVNASPQTISIIDNIKDIAFQDGGMDDVYKDVLQGFKAEGSVIVQLGYNGETLTAEKCDLAELYFDSEKETLARDSERRGKTIKTIVRAVSLSYSEFCTLYPQFADKVVYGEPTVALDKDVYNTNERKTDDKVVVHYAYTIEGEPRAVVYAGGSSTLIEELSGKDYPYYRKNKKGKDVAFLPFVDFHYTTVKRGFYSQSIIGVVKDAGSAYQKILNISLPMFSKAVNPITLLFGTKSERAVDEMMLAQELQEVGIPQMIPVGENVSMQTVRPDSVFNDFDIARTTILRDLAMRTGINFQALEELEQTATEFVGKTKTELTAVQAIYITNNSSFSIWAEYIVAMASKYWKKDDAREFKVVIDENIDDEFGLTIADSLGELKEWRGSFVTETDLKMPVSTQDKVQAISEMETSISNVFYGRQFNSPEEIEIEIDGLVKRAVLRDLDDIYTRAKLIAKASLIVGQAQQLAEQSQQGFDDIQGNQDIAKELAPQTFLAEAGL